MEAEEEQRFWVKLLLRSRSEWDKQVVGTGKLPERYKRKLPRTGQTYGI